MKNIIIATVFVAMSLLTACGGGAGSSSSTSAPATTSSATSVVIPKTVVLGNYSSTKVTLVQENQMFRQSETTVIGLGYTGDHNAILIPQGVTKVKVDVMLSTSKNGDTDRVISVLQNGYSVAEQTFRVSASENKPFQLGNIMTLPPVYLDVKPGDYLQVSLRSEATGATYTYACESWVIVTNQ